MIIGVVPDPRSRLGAGKSCFAVWLISVLSEKTGKQIRSNLHLYKTDYDFIENYDDLIDLHNSAILIDDIYRAIPAGKMAKAIRYFTGTIRHHNNDLIYTSSRLIDYVNKSFRLHTNIFAQVLHDAKTDTIRIAYSDQIGRGIKGFLPNYLPPEIVREVYNRYDTNEDVNIWSL
jgi:hypothetical protein